MRIVATLLILGLMVYAVLDCVRTEHERRPVGPTWAWVLLIVAVPVIGAIAWLLVSRIAVADGQAARQPGPTAPDDDPEFLRMLERRAREEHEGRQPHTDEAGDHDSEPEADGGPAAEGPGAGHDGSDRDAGSAGRDGNSDGDDSRRA